MSDECRGDCRVMTAVSNDPEMGNVEMTFREAIEMYVSRTHNLEAALAVERARATEAILAREALWRHYRRCTEALGLTFDQVPENPEKELEMWRGMRARVAELEADRERLEKLVRNAWTVREYWAEFFVQDRFGTRLTENYKTAREAIDAAREAAKGEVKRS